LHALTYGSKVRKSALFAESAPEARRLLRVLGIGCGCAAIEMPTHRTRWCDPPGSRPLLVVTDAWPPTSGATW
jgi:hypothetical protein